MMGSTLPWCHTKTWARLEGVKVGTSIYESDREEGGSRLP